MASDPEGVVHLSMAKHAPSSTPKGSDTPAQGFRTLGMEAHAPSSTPKGSHITAQGFRTLGMEAHALLDPEGVAQTQSQT